MFELIKKSIFAGIGVLALTEEKVRELTNDFVKKGKLTAQEGESLVDEVQKVIEENKAKLSTLIDERVQSIANDLHLITKDDLAEMEENLKKDVITLEERLEKLENQVKNELK